MRRTSILSGAAACAVALFGPPVAAQADFPNKPVRIVHGFTVGGISDVLARAIAARLAVNLGQPIMVDPRGGAGTTIASEHVARSPADGYTLFLQDMTTHAINASLYRRLKYDSVRDFTPVTLIAFTPLILVVHPSLPAKNVKELVGLARRHPGEVAFGSSGNGTIVHLAGEMLNATGGIRMTHIPYKGSPQAITGLLGGEIALIFASMPPALPMVAAGRLRALGVTTPERTAAAPEVPTMKEGGLKDFELVLYSGILAPRGVPRPIVDRFNAEFGRVVRHPDVQAVYAKFGAVAMTDTPEEFASHIQSEMIKIGKLVQLSGARVD
ncbi:MAG: tripartite tricarboxylate transporter substrate binding protein [Burkholderiales bacterium]|nr:tripartite tricarboxylate transporter substrate binding protein [Burkholderiales bacterium]